MFPDKDMEYFKKYFGVTFEPTRKEYVVEGLMEK